ncbi:MAG TPA: hypothetical protein DDW87_05045 [Firmicutes bacterium]|nr:hypothetical protein [Bacillota bacterium]
MSPYGLGKDGGSMGSQSEELSATTIKTILQLQQNETTEQAVYLQIAKRVKKQSDKEVLQRIAKEGDCIVKSGRNIPTKTSGLKG